MNIHSRIYIQGENTNRSNFNRCRHDSHTILHHAKPVPVSYPISATKSTVKKHVPPTISFLGDFQDLAQWIPANERYLASLVSL